MVQFPRLLAFEIPGVSQLSAPAREPIQQWAESAVKDMLTSSLASVVAALQGRTHRLLDYLELTESRGFRWRADLQCEGAREHAHRLNSIHRPRRADFARAFRFAP